MVATATTTPDPASLLLAGVEAASETGYRLCRLPTTREDDVAAAAAETRLARALPDGSGRVALADEAGALRVLAAATQDVVGRFRVYLGSFAEEGGAGEEEDEAGARPQPCALPLTDVAFVPPTAAVDETTTEEQGRQQGLFLLLGETDTVMYATLPPALPEDEEDGASASRRYAYGSPLLALRPHKARVTAMAVDHTASVLASGDAKGNLRVWGLLQGEEEEGGGGGGVVGGGMVVDVAAAHEGPVLALAHGEALPGEEGHIVTGGRDRSVRVWAWWVDEWGRLGVRLQHTLLMERCEVRCLGAGQGLGLVVGGTDRGALYCWSSLTSVLEYVAVGGEAAVTAVAALAEEGEEGDGEEAASLVATADAAGVVRLYRPAYLDPAKAPLPGEEGAGDENDDEEDSAWQPVAEARLDAPAVAAMVVGSHLVVVSRSGLVMPWPLATLPRFPGEERRAPPPPPPPASTIPSSAPSSTDEEEEDRPRRAPPPAPTSAAAQTATDEKSVTAAAEAYLAGLRGAMERGGHGHPFVACELGAPAVNSTAAVRAALEAARLAEFDAGAGGLGADVETASVLAEAARAVNVDPRYRAYRGLRRVEDVRLPPPKVVRRQVDPAWRAKQALRPTARDFFTPGLEGLVVGGGGGAPVVDAGTVPLWPRGGGRGRWGAEGEGENAERGRAVDPYLAMYGDAV